MRVKTTVLVATVLLAATVFQATTVLGAQELTTDEVIAKSVEAQGGQESWAAVSSLVLKGTFSTFSVDHPFVLYRMRPFLYRFEHVFGDWPMTYGFDGKSAWWETPAFFSPATWQVEVPLNYQANIAADAVFGNPIVDYGSGIYQAELVGRTDLDGVDVYELVVTFPHGAQERWFLDAESFLPYARVSMGAYIDQMIERWSYFDDYREVAGIELPFRVESEMGSQFRQMKVESAEANVPLDAALFSIAPPEGMKRLQGLAGTWQVEASSRPQPVMPWMSFESTSVIEPVFNGSLLAEEMSYIDAGAPRHVRRWYSYDRFREVFRVTYFDSLTGHVNVLEGSFGDDDRLVLSNVGTGTTWNSQGRTIHNRQVVYDIGANGFKVDWEASVDDGQTWWTRAKFTYTRKQVE